MVLEVGRSPKPVGRGEGLELLRVQEFADLVAVPDMKATFLAVRIRVDTCRKSAVGLQHCTPHPAGDAFCRSRQACAAVSSCSLGIERQQLSVVVKHLLEVGNGPAAIDAVTEEAAVEMVSQSARRHPLQRKVEAFLYRIGVCQRRASEIGRQFQHRRLRELWRTTVTAVITVEAGQQVSGGLLEQGLGLVLFGLAYGLLRI